MLSRSAYSMYWLGRYMERAENTIRLLRVRMNFMVGQAAQAGNDRGWQQFFSALRQPPPLMKNGVVDSEVALQMAHNLTFDAEKRNSISNCINLARTNARSVRSQMSSQLWEHINRLYLRLHSWQGHHNWHDERDNFFRELETSVSLFQGLAFSTQLHDEGWLYIQVGGHLERVFSVCSLLQAHFRYFGVEGGEKLETVDPLNGIGVLRACNSFESYCRVYDPRPETRDVTTFLLLNAYLPYSARFNVNQLDNLLEQLAGATETRRAGDLNRTAGKLRAHLQYSQIDDVVHIGAQPFIGDIMKNGDQIHDALNDAYFNYPIDEAFS